MNQPFFILAPMDDVTDTVFRQMVAGCAAPDLYMTEFVSVDGLQSKGRERLLPKLRLASSEHNVIAQIWGKTPEHYYKTAQELVEMGFAGVDINMGCPDKTVVKNGCCSALIDNRTLAAEIIQATKEGLHGKLPLSVKTRLGSNVIDLSWHEFLLGFDLAMLTVHGRTRKEMSLVPAHWDEIAKVRVLRDKIAPATKLVGNGDVINRQHGIELARQTGVDGIMIGRGIFKDPYAFANKSPWAEKTPEARRELYKKHIQLFAETWVHHERKVVTLNKFCKIYINGFAGASELREKLMRCITTDDLLATLSEFDKL